MGTNIPPDQIEWLDRIAATMSGAFAPDVDGARGG